MENNKNLKHLEYYLQNNKQLIIIISGLSGVNKIHYGQYVSRLLNIKYINHLKFLNKKYTDKNIYNDDYIDWNSFNKKINSVKNQGVVITSTVFPTDLIKFKADIHINLYISKNEILKNLKKISDESSVKNISKKNKKTVELKKLSASDDDNKEISINKIKNIIYTYYINITKRSKFDIIYDISKYTIDNLENDIIKYINDFLLQFYIQNNNLDESEDNSNENSIDISNEYDNITYVYNDNDLIILKY